MPLRCLVFGIIPLRFPHTPAISTPCEPITGQFSAAGLTPYTNNWSRVHDFTPVAGSANYSLITEVVLIMHDPVYVAFVFALFSLLYARRFSLPCLSLSHSLSSRLSLPLCDLGHSLWMQPPAWLSSFFEPQAGTPEISLAVDSGLVPPTCGTAARPSGGEVCVDQL